MSKHTPGPWYSNGGAIEQDVPPGELGSVIAFIEDEENDDHAANARLIAAAPDMLAALLDIRDFLRRNGYDLSMVNAVISKASGKENRT